MGRRYPVPNSPGIRDESKSSVEKFRSPPFPPLSSKMYHSPLFPLSQTICQRRGGKKKGRKNKSQEQKDLIRYLFFPFQFFKSEAVNELMLGNFLHMITAKLLIVHYFIYQIQNLHKSNLFKIQLFSQAVYLEY